MNVTLHIHLGFILDAKLSFSYHNQTAISKSRKVIGMLHFLSKYFPQKILIDLYELCVPQYLDHGDIIYHIPRQICDHIQHISLNNLVEQLETVPYLAAFAVTEAWRGTSRENLYDELEWESFNLRRWRRRLVLFYKIFNTLTPDHTRIPIPSTPELFYSLRKHNEAGQMYARTASYEGSFYPHCVSEWNKLFPEIRLSPTISAFKNKVSSLMRSLLNQSFMFMIQQV